MCYPSAAWRPGGPMNPAEHRSFVERLIEQPYDEATLRSVYEAAGTNPDSYAGLLVVAGP